MRRLRPVWAVIAAMCVAVVLASVVASVATGMGWWEWTRYRNGAPPSGEITIGLGGMRYREWSPSPPLIMGIPLIGTMFRPRCEPAWIPCIAFGKANREIVVPFWTIGAVALAGCVFASRRAIRVKTGHCAKCGYDLNGLSAEAVCPECGAKAASGGAGVPPAFASREP